MQSTSGNRLVSRVIIIFAIAFVLALGAALGTRLTAYWWHAGTLSAALGILLLIYFAPPYVRRSLAWLLVIFAGIISVWTILNGSGYVSLPEPTVRGRVQLIFSNPNLLASALAMSGIASLVVVPRKRSALVATLAILALGFTASRVALLAGVGGIFVAGAVYPLSRRARFGVLLVALALVCLVALSIWSTSLVGQRNLLRSSNNLAHAVWYKDANPFIVEPGGEGPVPDSQASRLQATAHTEGTYPSLLVWQRVEPIQPDTPYIASIYIRADEPQEVVLHFRRSTTCLATQVWQRCSTPVVEDFRHAHSQFQLRVSEPGTSLDIEVWGAQVEIGTEPSEPELTNTLIPAFTIARRVHYSSASWLRDVLESSNVSAMQAAWQMFLAHPLVGIGLNRYASLYEEFRQDDVQGALTHAHNLPLQMLAETGLFGFLSWALPFFGVLALGWRQHWRRLLPLVLTVLAINTFDFTYYSNGVYYVYWLAVGLIIFSEGEGVRCKGAGKR